MRPHVHALVVFLEETPEVVAPGMVGLAEARLYVGLVEDLRNLVPGGCRLQVRRDPLDHHGGTSVMDNEIGRSINPLW